MIDRYAERQKTAALKDKRQISIKRIIFVLCLLSFVLCQSCHQDNWMDWKFQNDLWLAKNKTEQGVKTTSSGLQYRIIADPLAEHDAKPKPTSTVVCDYTLKLINGTVIDSRENQPIYLPGAVPGFQEGCIKVHTHGDIELFIPAELGYDYDTSDERGSGTEGYKSYIPPYSTLIFTVHICSFY